MNPPLAASPEADRRPFRAVDWAYGTSIAASAHYALLLELDTWPKPGSVSHVDSGSHLDMTSETVRVSAESLRACFGRVTVAGSQGAPMSELRQLGLAAERTMLTATGGVNTQRGAIFGLGLLCAAAGYRQAIHNASLSLGEIVAARWGRSILSGPLPASTHGVLAMYCYGAGGVRVEAASGFQSVYRVALPALRGARGWTNTDDDAHRVHVLFALMAEVDDTNLLHREGAAGAAWAKVCAQGLFDRGSIGRQGWLENAVAIHREFVMRGVSPGGCADLSWPCASSSTPSTYRHE
jgi:triphosphoribosyl-dephospho-CoA synthase